jgi:hypothetical protein
MANTYEQANVRFRDDSTALNTDGGWLALENANVASRETGTTNRFRIRMTLGNNNGKAADYTPQLTVDKDGGGYNNVNGSSSNVRSTGGLPGDGDPITTQLLGDASQGTWEAEGDYDEGDGLAGTFSHEKNGFTEFEWCVYIVDADVANGNVLTFRASGIDTPATNEPTVTVSKAVTSTPYYYHELIGYGVV